METEYYPWGGEYTICSPTGCVAVVLLTTDYIPPDIVAIYGFLKTENIGIEKIVANVISNPYIRYLVVCGEDIRGHYSGASLVALYKNGIDEQHRIIDAPGAIPYIENLDVKALERFQEQIELVNLIGITKKEPIDKSINDCTARSPGCFGKPYIAIQIKPQTTVSIRDARALHSKIIISYLGSVEKRRS